MLTRPLLPLLALLSLTACAPDGPPQTPMTPTPSASTPAPDRITIDHILIGVKGPRFPQGRRAEAAARSAAYELLEKLKAGGDWDAAKRTNSEDPPPGGPYALANRGVRPSGPGEYGRDTMVPGFGDVGFALAVGAIGIADFDAVKSPFGYHIIKRVK